MPKVKIGKSAITHDGQRFEVGETYEVDGEVHKALTARIKEPGPRKGAYEHDIEEVS